MSKQVNLVITVPKWANWIAQNREGDWWAFAGEPQIDNTHQCWRHEMHSINEPCMRFAVETGPIEKWKTTREHLL